MFTKNSLALLALATLSANGALAAAGHRNHAQRHQHQKKDMVYETTTTVVDTTWTTVYVDGDGDPIAGPTAAGEAAPASSSSSVSTSSVVYSTSSSTVAAAAPATTFVTATTQSPDVAAVQAATTVADTTTAETTTADAVSEAVSAVTSAAAAVTSAAATTASSSGSSSSSSSGSKRGAAYNDASLISPLTDSGTKISWAYNWGATSGGLSDDLEFVPMLWCSTGDYPTDWSTNAQSAIDSGAKYLLGFNEPDNPSQCDIDASTAATAHIKYMNPFSSKASIGAPSITNSNTDGESIDWLKSFVSACAGQCEYDFCPVHWYNTIDAGAEDLYNFVTEAQSACGTGKNVWITEFAPNVNNPTDAEISSFLEEVQDTFDNNSTYSFVERYSYFWVTDGLLVNNGEASTYGKTFAYS